MASKESEIFASVCALTNDYMGRRKLLREGTLFDLSRYAVKVIQNLPDVMPPEYYDLYERSSDYWLYEIENDHDERRIHAYTRVFQIMTMVRIAMKDRERTAQLNDEVSNITKNHYRILTEIHNRPGLTCKQVQETIRDISIEDILRLTSQLVEKDLLLSRKQNTHQYYILTSLGEELLVKLNGSRNQS